MRRKRGLAARDRLGGVPVEPVGQPIVHRSPVWEQVSGQRPGTVAATDQTLASGGRRIVAWIIDAFVLFVLFLPVHWLFDSVFGQDWIGDAVPSLLYTGLSAILGAIYFVLLWTGGRSTVGMRVLGIRVVDAASGGPVLVPAAVRRWLLLEGVLVLFGYVSDAGLLTGQDVLAFSAGLASLLWPVLLLATTLMNPARQGLHDRYARTYVVRR